MTMMLRLVLIAGSLLTTAQIIRKIRQSKAQIEDSVFWVFVSAVLILFSIFPGAADLLSGLVGTYSTSNFIFLFIIFLLMVKVFSLTLRVSQLEAKQRELIQRIALKDKESVTISGLPAGLTYTVAETQANKEGYSTSSTGTEHSGGSFAARFFSMQSAAQPPEIASRRKSWASNRSPTRARKSAPVAERRVSVTTPRTTFDGERFPRQTPPVAAASSAAWKVGTAMGVISVC